MEQIISKEELNELMKLKGEIRMGGVKNNAEFILEKEGEEGLRKLEEAMASIGFPIEYRKIRDSEFRPTWFLAIHLLAIKRVLNYDDKKFQEMGTLQGKSSFMARIFMRYFISLERGLKQIEKAWDRYNTVGKLELVEYDVKRGYAILRIRDFKCHPLQCQIFKGLFSTMPKMIVKREATCEETKCIHRGDEYHEFMLRL